MATVGTARVTIEADFSRFEQDVQTFFNRSGKAAGDALNRGVKSGADAAQKSVKDVGTEFQNVASSASSAGRDASSSWAAEMGKVGTSTQKSAAVASSALTDLSGKGASAASRVSSSWVSSISGVASSTSSAASAASSSLDGVGRAASGAASGIRVSFANGFGGVASAASGMVSRVSATMGSVASSARGAAESIKTSITNALKESEQTADRVPSAIGRIGVAVGAIAGPMAILKGGFDRLMNIQRAEVMFKSVGLSAEQTKNQMAKLTEQVTGTSVSLADAAKYSAMFAQSGVELGKPMDSAIQAFTALSSIAEGSGVDVGRVMQQISAQGKVTGEDMAQMADAGVNATKYLADSMGMSQADVKKAISDGKISFEDFVTAINKGTGSLAKDMGQTLPAKIANFKTSLSAFGATLLEPMIGPMTKAVEFLTGVFKGLNQPIKDFVTWLGEGSLAADAFKGVMIVVGGVVAGAVALMAVGALASLGSMIGGFVLGGLQATITGAKMVAAAWTTVAGWARAAGAMAIQVAKMIGQWVMLGGQALVQAGRVAAAWIMAAPKNLVQYTIAFVQIIAGWVRMAAVATVQAIKAGAAWIIAAPKNLGTYARAFGAMIAGWGQAAGAAIVNAGRIAGAWIIAAPKNLGAGVKALGMIAGGWVRAGIAAVANAAVIAGSWLVAMWPVALVIAAIVGIIGVFKLLWDNVAGFREFWQGVWDGLVNVVATAWTWIKNIIVGTWDAIVGWFQSGGVQAVWQTLVDGAQAAWNIITAVWGGLVDFFGGIFSGLATAFSAVWDVIGTAFMWVWESVLSPIYTWIADTWGRIAEIIAPVWDTITEKVAAFGSWFMDFWNTTLWPIVSQVVDFFKRIGEAVGGFISDHWPVLQKVLMIIGGVLLTPIIIGLGLVVGAIVAVVTIVGVVIGAITGLIYVLVQLPGWISQAVTAIKDWFGQAWQWTKDKFAAMGDAVSGWWRDHVAPLPGRVGQAIGGVIDWFKGLPGRIRGALSDAGSWLIDTGKNIVQGLINGMTSLAGKIGSYFLDKIPGWIRKPFESALGIHSPSRVFAGYGENIGQGLINGVQSMAGSVKGAAQSLANSAADVSLPEVAAPTVAAPVVPAPVPGIAVDSVAQMPGDGAALGAMMQQQQESMLAWGATAQQQTGEVVNPALASVGTTAQTMNDTQFQPVMLGMQTAMSATGSAVLAMTSTAWTPAMLGMQAASNATGANTSWNAYGVVNPALFSIANTAWNVLNTGVNPAMAGIRGALTYTANTFGWAAGNIAQQWNQVREATARPVRFAIQSVFNDGIVGMWNSASELLGTQKMAPYPVRFATGGLVRGPGGPKDDKIPALLSNHEYVLNAKAVRNIGVDNLNALNSGGYRVAPQVLRDPEKRRAMLRDKTFTNVAARYQGGGLAEGTPAWKALLRGYNWARSRNGRPYVWGGSAHGDGGTDCSGFMSGIADVILGGSGARQWATGNFPGSQQGAWKPGLAAGFAVGISDVHTAGTIGGAPGIPAVNVESGGINSRVKFGTSDAAGANDSQFNRRFSLIVTDSGAFVPGMGGGASMVDIIGGLTKPFQERMSSAAAGWAQSHAGIINTYPQKLSETLGKITRDKITKLSEEMMGDPGGVGAERWRPMAKRAMARVGFNWQDKRQVDAMIAQIQSESGGIPNRAQEIVDVNGTGASAGLGLLQIIPTTFAAHRDPELPNDRTNPFANMVAALRYYKSRYGMDLTTMWGHGHGYDRGGLITDRGLFSKQTTQAERVLSPRQTGAFEELVGFLGSADWQSLRDAGATITGDSGGRSVRTVEVTLNYYGSGDGEDVADAVEQRLIRSAW